MIIEERDYRVKAGKLGQFVSLYERHGLPIQLELLGQFLGYFTTEARRAQSRRCALGLREPR